MNLQGIIFDLDGTLINSEPLWEEAVVAVLKEVGLEINSNDYLITKGMPVHEVAQYWHNILKNPQKPVALLAQEMGDLAFEKVIKRVELNEGALELLEFLNYIGYPMGIASASSMKYILAVVEKFNLGKYFRLTYSGDFERFGKPHPGIYMSACKKLKIDPIYSLAFEDSFHGVLAAKSARLKVCALLNQGQISDTKFDFADLKIESLVNFGAPELASIMQSFDHKTE